MAKRSAWVAVAAAPLFSLACPAAGQEVAQEAGRQSTLVDLVGPVTVDDRYLGDVDLQIAPDESGTGKVDVLRLAELLRPLLSAETQRALADLAAPERFRAFAEVTAGGLSIRYDPNRLGIVVTVPTQGRPRSSLRISGQEAPRLGDYAAPADLAAGVQLTGRKTLNYRGEPFRSDLEGRAEGFVTIGGFEGFTLSSALDYRGDATRAFQVDGVSLTHDDFEHAIRYQAGTTLPQPVGLQSAAVLRGIGVGRRYQVIRPFQNIRPTGRQSILVERPSTADIYVNNVLVTRTTLAPGPYDLDDFPLTQGGNDVRLVVQDSTGASQTIDRAVFFSPVVLAPGLTDFGFWAGVTDTPVQSGRRPLVATGYLLRGVERATLGINGQASERGLQVGASAVRAFRPGFVSFDLAWGGRPGGASGVGVAMDLQLNLSLRAPEDLTLTSRAEARSADFFSPVEDAALNPVRYRFAGTANYRLDPRTSVSLGGSSLRAQRSQRLVWAANGGLLRQFGRLNASVFLQQERLEDGRGASSVRFGLSAPLGSSATATARVDTRNGRSEVDFSRFRRSIGPDWAGRLTVGRQDGQTDALGQLQWFGQRAFASVTHLGVVPPNGSGLQDTQRTFIDVASFIGVADGRVGFGREGVDGFSLVRVHPSLDKAGVRVQHYGQTVFRDDGLGPIVLPFQRGYSPVQQEFLADRLPDGYALPDPQQQIFPGLRSGYRFTVGSDAYLSVQGVLLGRDGAPAALRIGKLQPVAANLPTIDFFTAEDGSFFAQGLARGAYRILIDKEAVGTVQVTPGADLLVQLGEVKSDAK